jgi:FkbM family methyltransferase
MIPRLFHHIWLGAGPVPEEVENLRKTWLDHHPAWEARLWSMPDFDWLENQALFDRATSYAQKADIARYEVIRRFGGVYVDADMECVRPLDELLTEEVTFFSGREATGYIAIGLFGAVPNHALLDEMVASLPVSCLMNRRLGVSMQTGPGLLTTIVKRFKWEGRAGVRIFPLAFFYPYDYSEPWRRSEHFPDAFAIHHWGHSWKGANGVIPTERDLLPSDWSDFVIKARSFGHAGFRRPAQMMWHRMARPFKQRLKVIIERAVGGVAPPVHGIPWGRDHVLVATPLGTRLLVPNEDISIAPELALRGVYDQPFIDFLVRSLRPGMIFVDVGANVGLFTVVGAALVGSGGHVYAYECNPGLVEYLRQNVQMNWFNERVEIVPKAAGRDSTPIKFWMSPRLGMLGSTVPGNALQSDQADAVELEVPGESLDHRFMHGPYVDLMKVDVEGGEPAVLDGARALFDADKIGMLSLEFRSDALTNEARMEMARRLTEIQARWAVTFHVPGEARAISLDEVLGRCEFSQLIVRFRHATIQAS